MSSDILIVRAKPSSKRKSDEASYIDPQYRKAGEWFDIKNFQCGFSIERDRNIYFGMKKWSSLEKVLL